MLIYSILLSNYNQHLLYCFRKNKRKKCNLIENFANYVNQLNLMNIIYKKFFKNKAAGVSN